MLVEKTLEHLKNKLKKDNFFEIYEGEGRVSKVTCTFGPPVPPAKIKDFEKQTKIILPEDYKQFLQLHNGISLFDDVKCGGECKLYNIEYILETYLDTLKYSPKGWLFIGYHYGDEIVLDCEKFNNGDKYCVLYRDACEPAGLAYDLKLSFELWLDRLVICQGLNFWNPPMFSIEDTY